MATFDILASSHGKSLDDFFVLSPGGDTTSQDGSIDAPLRACLLELEIQQIASLLEPINSRWARVPRLYTVLRLIDQLPLLDSIFLAQGLSDFWLPFSLSSLPDGIPLAVRSAFVRTQPLVLTKAVDLEKGERGRHRNFGPDEPLPFKSKGPLGAGGFGAVDKVVSTVSGREYARKRLPRGVVAKGSGGAGPKAKEHMKAFRAELEVLKRLRHRHVVEYVGSYTDTQHLGIIMAPVADGNLAWFLDAITADDKNAKNSTSSLTSSIEFTSPAEKRALLRSFFGCLASALDYLHSSQIRHKDIKPQNILVMAGTGVLLTDFGLSLDWGDLSRSTTKGVPAALTPRYAAPEVAEHEPRGTSADIWSLGCVFLEMVTVLKGETLEAMKTFYESHGSESVFYRVNELATEQWMKTLGGKGGTRADDAPLTWIGSMMERERKNRVTSAALLERIAAKDPQTGQASRFCGTCCMPEGESDDEEYEDEYEEEDSQDEAINTPAASIDIDAELRILQQAAGSLTRDSVSSPKWREAADKALSRLENDPSLPLAAASELFHELATLLRDASWCMVSGEITGSAARSQAMAKEMLELLERAAMLRLSPEQKTEAGKEELTRCIKYMSALLKDERSIGRLREARERLLGDDHGADERDISSESVVVPTPEAFPLHAAAQRDDLAALTQLLATGIDVNLQDDDSETPLHHAARAGSESCAIKLLSSGAKASAEDKDRCSPLHLASQQGNRIILRELVRHPTARLNAKTSKKEHTPLHLAVIADNVDAADLLLGAGVNSGATDAEGRFPASYVGSGEMVNLLLRHGVNFSVRDIHERTALHWAVRENRDGVIPALLDAGLKASDTGFNGETALHMAVAAHGHDLVKLLLSRDVSAIDSPMRRVPDTTPLHVATTEGDDKMVQLLLDHGAEARFSESPPLNIAVANGRLDIVKLFHARGQDLNIRSRDSDKLPLDVAASKRDLAMGRYLVENGAQFSLKDSPNSTVRRPYYYGYHNALLTAIGEGDEELTGLLLDSLGDDAKPGSGAKKIRSKSPAFTAEGNFRVIPLYSSIFDQNHAITRMLLDRGADPDGPNRVPLIAAAIKDDVDAARLLFEHGVDVHKRDTNNKAPIHHAAADASVAMVELFVAHGADVNQLSSSDDRFPTNAAYYALTEKKPEILEFLIHQAGAQVYKNMLSRAASKELGGMMATLLSRPDQHVPAPPTPEELGKLLIEATRSDSNEAVDALLKAGAPVVGPDIREAVLSVINHGNEIQTALLIEAGADFYSPEKNSWGQSSSPEERALCEKNTGVLKLLLESPKARGSRTRAQVLEEWLRYSGRSVGHEVVKWLYEQGATGNVRSQYKYAPPGYIQSPLQWAVDNKDIDMTRDRLAKGDDVAGLAVCHTPLQFAAAAGDAKMVKLLLDHGAGEAPRSVDDVGVPPGIDSIRETPLLSAVEAVSIECVRLLLAAGADPNLNRAGKGQNSRGQYLPLAKAVSQATYEMYTTMKTKGKLETLMDIIHALLDAGADPVKPSGTGADALYGACNSDVQCLQLVTLLLDHCQEGTIRTGGVPGLFIAAEKGRIELVKLLLDRGVDMNGVRSYSRSKLLWSCTKPKNERVVRLLVQQGADPDEKGDGYNRESAREKAEKTYDTLLIDAMSGK
ncbi:Ankyrin-1 [Drechslerella dactyloides]|uniref:Ankyrin-1 n=1 Tax=Drechslerella dactyloides TaxID=74499 RepID=A0AAD6NJF5_DREDA|nr:Ankyrin-1 [Drechslerella dactyloides]